MSLLTNVQKHCRRVGINAPASVVGNSDSQIAQILELANEEGTELAARTKWSKMIRERTFTIALSASQGAMNGTVITDSDFDYIIPETFWNRTTSMPIVGPVTDTQWQTLQAFPVTGPYQQWRLLGKNLYIDPVPTVADTAAFEYMSTSWCESSGGTGQSAWAADTDVGLLDENLMILGLKWRWRQAKGLDYAEDFNTYERRVMDAMAREGGKPIKYLDGMDRVQKQAGIIVPIGSWTP